MPLSSSGGSQLHQPHERTWSEPGETLASFGLQIRTAEEWPCVARRNSQRAGCGDVPLPMFLHLMLSYGFFEDSFSDSEPGIHPLDDR